MARWTTARIHNVDDDVDGVDDPMRLLAIHTVDDDDDFEVP